MRQNERPDTNNSAAALWWNYCFACGCNDVTPTRKAFALEGNIMLVKRPRFRKWLCWRRKNFDRIYRHLL